MPSTTQGAVVCIELAAEYRLIGQYRILGGSPVLVVPLRRALMVCVVPILPLHQLLPLTIECPRTLDPLPSDLLPVTNALRYVSHVPLRLVQRMATVIVDMSHASLLHHVSNRILQHILGVCGIRFRVPYGDVKVVVLAILREEVLLLVLIPYPSV